MVTAKFNVTPASSVDNTRYSKFKDDNNKAWTEVIPKKRTSATEGKQKDPFAGMKSFVDYEQEIERLKQLVPKALLSSTSNSHYSTNASIIKNKRQTSKAKPSHYNINNIINNNHVYITNNNNNNLHSATETNITKTTATSIPPPVQQTNATTTITTASVFRPNGPDSSTSSTCSTFSYSDSDTCSLPEETSIVITVEEKARFLAFVRSWTGDWRKGEEEKEKKRSNSNNKQRLPLVEDNNSCSLWAEQSPWTYSTMNHQNNVSIMPSSNSWSALVQNNQCNSDSSNQHHYYHHFPNNNTNTNTNVNTNVNNNNYNNNRVQPIGMGRRHHHHY